MWDRHNIDWVPTLNLGHGKSVKRREQNEAQEARAERLKERGKRQAELQEQERLLKLQKLNEPGVPLADFASEIVEIESLNTSEAEQVQEETVDLQPDKQVTHDCSTQTEALIIYIDLWHLSLLRTVHALMLLLKQKSLTTCLPIHRRASLSSRIILGMITRKCHSTQACQHTKC